ncbi:sigma 54-interacting transcriptional regulator [Alkalihalobacillus sp. MEB130]|uniref:sigma 54-interacting transcriptional regulator n=1 Tax=Alkalihalobacillus sp. MEB130 TaxID=2976704 RepID=UPI0028DF8707|nr:sigma 54-interacting transcriptional regulator [Alkalihalobacillus sp. MEB130]MDT8862151.1 sigma 54-interacting transcriptional regulator [Alkalihalobacillus sp. MEB130]
MINIKINMVVPCNNFIEHAFETFKEHNQSETTDRINDEVIQYELEEIIANGEDLRTLKLDADVIMSRGITCQILKESNQKIPIVDIPVQGLDLIRCLYDCKSRFGNKKVGVIGSTNMIYGVEELTDIVGLSIKSFIMNNISESPSLVDKAASEGCEIILAGIVTCDYANKKGLHASIIRTGKESFRQSLSEAKRLALVSRREQEKTQLYQTILNYAYEGVIAIDKKDKITAFNTAAKETLSITNKKLIGSSVYDVVGQGKLRALLLNTEEYTEDIVIYQSIQLAVKKIGIFLKGERVGNMVAFQDVTGIQAMERKIRKKMHLRGHIAKHTFDDILHRSSLVKEVIETAKSFSEVESNILIVGETGTGKEVFAQSIHNHSNRKHGPFVAINCAALPDNLLESELFGYVEGAFTGAMKGGKPGFFELAHGGTIFLDEIGEISPQLQSRLLRVLQEREIMRIGDDKVIPTDVRVLSATNKNLLHLVKAAEFREDLYYRLDVLKITLPPLRQRKEDVPLLINAFIHEGFSPAERSIITDEAIKWLSEWRWEGNIRQLKNFCERLIVLSKDKVIDTKDVKNWLEGSSLEMNEREEEQSQTRFPNAELSEREKILNILKHVNYNKGKAALKLGISRTTLWRKLKEYNLETN